MSLGMARVTGEISHKKIASATKLQSIFFLHFHGTVSSCQPPASKQVLHFLKILLNTQGSWYLEILLGHMHSPTLSLSHMHLRVRMRTHTHIQPAYLQWQNNTKCFPCIRVLCNSCFIHLLTLTLYIGPL